MKMKICQSPSEAVSDIYGGATVMLHAFGGPGGIPQSLIVALRDQGTRNLTVIACWFGAASGVRIKEGIKSYVTPGLLVESGQVRKAIATWVPGMDRDNICALEDAVVSGKVEFELVSQGTLAERIRAGAAGMGPFYSPVGVGTILEEGKEKRTFEGREYLLERPLRADFGFVRAYKADKMGNLIYRGSSRSYNPLIAMAADITIGEVDEIVEVGELNPDEIVTPGVFVDRVVRTKKEVP